MTTSHPLCVVAMEFAAQLELIELRSAELFLDWVPRHVNKEADALADGWFEGFDPRLRVLADFARTKRPVLDRLLSAGAAFQREADKRKAARAVVGSPRREVRRKTQRLREREPW